MTEFKEMGRTTVNDSRDIVMSQVIEDGEVKGININSYIRTNGYTGFTKGGVFVPVEKVQDFKNLVERIMTDSND